MRTVPVPMTVEEYHKQPIRPGWKCEYYGGQMWLQPRHSVAVVRCETAARPVTVADGFHLRPAVPEDAAALIPAFYDAFCDSVDYWGYSQAAVRKSAQDSIASCFAGKRGVFHPTSFLAVAPTGRSVAGAAMVVTDVDGPNLDLLFVRPRWQRHGLAMALVQSAVNVLHELGEPTLDSGYVVANAESAAWHTRFGFRELPDLTRAKEEAFCARWELRRRTEAGELDTAGCRELAARAAHWKREVATLEAIAQRDGFEAVSPLLRRGQARQSREAAQ